MGVNETLNNLSEVVDVNKTIEKTGSFLDNFDFSSILSKIGSGVSKTTGFVVQKSASIGLHLSQLSIKLFSLVLLVGILLLIIKYGQKPLKYLWMGLVVFLISSVVAYIFIGE